MEHIIKVLKLIFIRMKEIFDSDALDLDRYRSHLEKQHYQNKIWHSKKLFISNRLIFLAFFYYKFQKFENVIVWRVTDVFHMFLSNLSFYNHRCSMTHHFGVTGAWTISFK